MFVYRPSEANSLWSPDSWLATICNKITGAGQLLPDRGSRCVGCGGVAVGWLVWFVAMKPQVYRKGVVVECSTDCAKDGN